MQANAYGERFPFSQSSRVVVDEKRSLIEERTSNLIADQALIACRDFAAPRQDEIHDECFPNVFRMLAHQITAK